MSLDQIIRLWHGSQMPNPSSKKSLNPKPIPRPRDPMALVKLIGDIATGQVEDIQPDSPSEPTADEIKRVMAALGKQGGLKGGKARAASLTPEKRSEIAKKAAAARWKSSDS